MRLGTILSAMSVAACAVPTALTVIGSTLGGANAVYQNMGLITGELAKVASDACHLWEIKHAGSVARIDAGVVAPDKASGARDTAQWGNAACGPGAPTPSSDPIEFAFWLADVAVREELLTAVK